MESGKFTQYRVKPQTSTNGQTTVSGQHRKALSTEARLMLLLQTIRKPKDSAPAAKVPLKRLSDIGKLAKSKSGSKSFVDLQSMTTRINRGGLTKPSAKVIDSMISDCSDVQQSLVSLWKDACASVSGNLQHLETSRQALSNSTSQPSTWKTSPKYLEKRDALDAALKTQRKRPSLRRSETLLGSSWAFLTSDSVPKHSKVASEPFSWKVSEEEELLDAIREYKKTEVELGDTFRPVNTPVVKKNELLPEELDAEALSDLNRFIFQKRKVIARKTTVKRQKTAKDEDDSAEFTPEVLIKARQKLQQEAKRRLKATRLDNYKPMTLASMLKSYTLPMHNAEQKELLSEIHAEEGNLHRRRTIEKYVQTSKRQIKAM